MHYHRLEGSEAPKATTPIISAIHVGTHGKPVILTQLAYGSC